MDYNIVYSSRKSISLTVKDGKLTVRAPRGVKKTKIEELVHNNRDWILRAIDRSLKVRDQYEVSHDEELALRKAAKKELKKKADYYATLMGLKYGRLTITGAKTRFGSCSSKGNISFSFHLMRYPESAIDYVVVHELAHVVHLNHSAAFWSVVSSVFPDYKERRALLKKPPQPQSRPHE